MLVPRGNERPQELDGEGPEDFRPGDLRRHEVFFQHRHPLAAARQQVRQNGPSDAATDDEGVVGHHLQPTGECGIGPV